MAYNADNGEDRGSGAARADRKADLVGGIIIVTALVLGLVFYLTG
ncbi:MAG: hypothetical protein P8Y95_13745 [Gammaproteobacteria bacterium]|jgi:hypothetical protein